MTCSQYSATSWRPNDLDMYTKFKISFWKQEPPNPTDAFRNLEPIENALESYKKLEEYYDVWILTSPSYHNPLCYSEKREWVETYLGLETCRKLIISPNKGLLKGDYLIDDNIHDGFEGELIHFGLNKKYPDWISVLNYLIK